MYYLFLPHHCGEVICTNAGSLKPESQKAGCENYKESETEVSNKQVAVQQRIYNGCNEGDNFGNSVSGAGDLNGDGSTKPMK